MSSIRLVSFYFYCSGRNIVYISSNKYCTVRKKRTGTINQREKESPTTAKQRRFGVTHIHRVVYYIHYNYLCCVLYEKCLAIFVAHDTHTQPIWHVCATFSFPKYCCTKVRPNDTQPKPIHFRVNHWIHWCPCIKLNGSKDENGNGNAAMSS